MRIEDRRVIIETCISSGTLIARSHKKIIKTLYHNYDDRYDCLTDSIADVVTDNLLKIMKLAAIDWPEDYSNSNSHIPAGLLYGDIKSKKVKKEFLERVLRI